MSYRGNKEKNFKKNEKKHDAESNTVVAKTRCS